MENLSLGKIVDYPTQYAPEILQAVPRTLSRTEIGLTGELPFTGNDFWNAYEVSWLTEKGKPVVAILECAVPFDSENLIESKSFKLYLNSFNQSRFSNIEEVETLLQKDLSKCAGKPVDIKLVLARDFDSLAIGKLDGKCIDHLDIEIEETTDILRNCLKADENADIINETLVSDLLKSNCLITNQPDWGSVLIKYEGRPIHHEGLLKYLVSFRQHNEFHEQCVERIFTDIMELCQPSKLTVYARYTRRGGLDINPFRSNFEQPYKNVRLARQ